MGCTFPCPKTGDGKRRPTLALFYKNLGVQSHPAVSGEIEQIVVSSQNVIWYRSRGEIEHLTGLKNRHLCILQIVQDT